MEIEITKNRKEKKKIINHKGKRPK